MKLYLLSLSIGSSHESGRLNRDRQQLQELGISDSNEAAQLSGDLQKLSNSMIQLEEQGNVTISDLKFLRSLYFQRFMARHDKIERAHSKTFEWMYVDSDRDARNPRRFVQWLNSEHGLFWIQGKAGSGKSTLMKFLTHHKLTAKHLQSWAGTDKLVMASYFFWAAGNELQKSQEGLLRTLLFEILRSCPKLIQQVRNALSHTETWEMSMSEATWSLTSLKKMLFVIRDSAPSAKFCFFIDGLDEYKGDTQGLIELVRAFEGYSHINMRYADSLDQMRDRLDRFPKDLESFFKHMLEDTPPFYRPETYRTFEIARAAHGPLPLVIYGYAEDIAKQPDMALTANTTALPEDELKLKIKYISHQLDARCKGLLEIVKRSDTESLYHINEVDFLHRTFSWPIQLSDYNGHSDELGDSMDKKNSVEQILNYAKQAQLQQDDNALLDPIIDATEEIFFEQCTGAINKTQKEGALLGGAAQLGLRDYVERKLSRRKTDSILNPLGRPLLDYVLDPKLADPTMVQFLLEYGLSPNQLYKAGTLWTSFLSYCAEHPRFAQQDSTCDIISLLIKHNADLDAIVEPNQGEYIPKDAQPDLWPIYISKQRIKLFGRRHPAPMRAQNLLVHMNEERSVENARHVIAKLYPALEAQLLAQAPPRPQRKKRVLFF
ncbi:hypothetical protein F5B19DRAFT_505232 [Rostrohypoxylon terebratum]|nr:hypothetical protein F5B19DRAFT_505232 [Rostrohypoxylon terebratum]